MAGRRADETTLVHQLLVRASQLGARLFRNNVGRLQDRRGTWVAYGLAPGSPDLVGWIPVTITPDMVGTRVAVFLGVEAKTPTGTLSDEQRAFLRALGASGAVSGVVRCEADLDMLLAQWRARMP